MVLANGSMSSTQSGEGEVVDCMIALPGQLFYSTQIPACLWFLAKDKTNGLARARSCATGAAKCCSSTPVNWA